MKSNLDKMNYTEYKKYLDNINIEYLEYENSEIPFGETITVCSTPYFKQRSFYVNEGEQTFKEEGLYSERELSRLDYFGFLDYLRSMNYHYEEIRGESPFDGFRIEVTPWNKSIKPRTFYCSRFTQTFQDPVYWYGDDDTVF